MREEDLRAVLSIEMNSTTTPWSKSAFSQEIANAHSVVKVAEVHGNVVGYICASYLHDEGHILNVAVHELHRRMGTASLLIKRMVLYLREKGCTKIFLEVRASNRIAIDMYKKLGFEHFGTRKDYYRKPRENAVVMMFDCSKG